MKITKAALEYARCHDNLQFLRRCLSLIEDDINHFEAKKEAAVEEFHRKMASIKVAEERLKTLGAKLAQK